MALCGAYVAITVADRFNKQWSRPDFTYTHTHGRIKLKTCKHSAKQANILKYSVRIRRAPLKLFVYKVHRGMSDLGKKRLVIVDSASKSRSSWSQTVCTSVLLQYLNRPDSIFHIGNSWNDYALWKECLVVTNALVTVTQLCSSRHILVSFSLFFYGLQLCGFG